MTGNTDTIRYAYYRYKAMLGKERKDNPLKALEALAHDLSDAMLLYESEEKTFFNLLVLDEIIPHIDPTIIQDFVRRNWFQVTSWTVIQDDLVHQYMHGTLLCYLHRLGPDYAHLIPADIRDYITEDRLVTKSSKSTILQIDAAQCFCNNGLLRYMRPDFIKQHIVHLTTLGFGNPLNPVIKAAQNPNDQGMMPLLDARFWVGHKDHLMKIKQGGAILMDKKTAETIDKLISLVTFLEKMLWLKPAQMKVPA